MDRLMALGGQKDGSLQVEAVLSHAEEAQDIPDNR